MASSEDRWPGPGNRGSGSSGQTRGSRRKIALIEDTQEWIESLENEAHWARTPAIRDTNTERARILKDLLELI